ncbi:hypothetical protein H2199_006203 [Coniosporium tulheliwenetii]|uniref:Uncharacterized protein n=1 Tax=Coniosporium tulheliwenetii TaxID=3383036 RepID=A0ACC2YX99_9PEZI|nr:hypothetical protein H2199_006203 [Cladosporium sp. JES 115]
MPGSNQIDPNRIPGRILYCNGQSIRLWEGPLPTGTWDHRVLSIYHTLGRFYAIAYDATKHQVGDGDDGDGPAYDSDDNDDSPFYADWSVLGFRYGGQARDGCHLSSATVPAEQFALYAHQSEQRWPTMLFSDIYHARDRSHRGGLIAELPVVLALVAFSTQPAWVESTLMNLFKNGIWGAHYDQHGRHDRRGMVVTVWCAPESNRAALERYESGRSGCIFH